MADEKFYYIEGSTSVKKLLKTIATEVTKNAGLYKWDLVYPSSLDGIGGSSTTEEVDLITDKSTSDKVKTKVKKSGAEDKIILSTTTTYGEKFYLKIERTKGDLSQEEKQTLVEFQSLHTYSIGRDTYYRKDAEVLEKMDSIGTYNTYVSAITKSNAINHVQVQFGKMLNSKKDDIEDVSKNYYYRLGWYKHLSSQIKEWLPVQYWLNITKDSINLVLRGDPSADVHPYNNYLTSYMYAGALKPVEDSAITDDEYNFGVTTSSDVEPTYSDEFGERTATGITDVAMFANKIGMPYQPHYPKLFTDNQFMDKCNVEGSRWNHKKHSFSDIELVHPIDRERGKMINVLLGDASALYDGDKLAYHKDESDEEYYKKFTITAPFNFINNSANVLYCIALRCYKTTE